MTTWIGSPTLREWLWFEFVAPGLIILALIPVTLLLMILTLLYDAETAMHTLDRQFCRVGLHIYQNQSNVCDFCGAQREENICG